MLRHRSYGRFDFLSRAVLSGAAGASLVSFSMTVFALLGVRWQIPTIAATAALLAYGMGRLLPVKKANVAALSAESFGTIETIACGLVLLVVAAALIATVDGAAGSPDLLFFWGTKAQQFAAARTVDAGFLRETFHRYMHVPYPPLVTNLGALATMGAGRFPWRAAILTFPLLLAALALGLPGILRGSIGRPVAAAVSALVISAMAYLGMEADIAGNGDMPLLFFETLGMALILSPAASDPAGQLLAGVLFAGAASAKVEGLPFVVAAATLFLLLRRGASRGDIGRSALRLLGPTALALAAWFAFGATRRVFYGYSEYGPLLDFDPRQIAAVLRATLKALISAGHGLPWLVPLICLLVAGRWTRMAAIPLGVAVALTGFLFLSYLHRVENLALWISWSASRVFSPAAMLFALAIGARDERT
jgi:hypothetical protein